MVKVHLLCSYCDSRWITQVYGNQVPSHQLICPKCQSPTYTKQDKLMTEAIDTYAGAPEFIKKEEPEPIQMDMSGTYKPSDDDWGSML